MSFGFEVAMHSDGRAHTGAIHTPHDNVRTPAFVPVGTKTSVKTVLPEAMANLSAQALLTNAYHLYLQPGSDLVDEADGLGRLMSWPGPAFTGSGGFQVTGLGADFREVLAVDARGLVGDDVIVEGKTRRAHADEDGVTSSSHLNGSRLRFTSEISVTTQHQFGADIMFAFDELTTPINTRDYQKTPVARTHRWTVQRLRTHATLTEGRARKPCQALLGAIRGAQYENLRRRVAADLAAPEVGGLRFDGFGLDGALGKENLGHIIERMVDKLPEDWPWHPLGISKPKDLSEVVAFGADTFDCVNPSRMARNATIYTADERYNVNTARNRRAFEPLEADCDCYTCAHYTRAYFHHLFKAKEMLASTLATIHNERFMIRLVDEIHTSLKSDEFNLFHNEFMGRYNTRKTQ